MKRTLIVRISGGLGNQMFQYATAYAVAKRWGARLLLHISRGRYSHGHHRPYGLSEFGICADVAPRFLSGPLYKLLSCSSLLPGLCFRLGLVDFVQEVDSYNYMEGLFGKEMGAQNVFLNGYWQSFAYFDGYEDDLRREFSIEDEPDVENREMLKKIQLCNDTVSIHIRRGDYLKVGSGLMLADDYYQRAVGKICESVPKAKLFIFSDDISWVRENIRFDMPSVYVDINSESSPVADMRLMSACRHHIIANSSFSWWGAWLGEKNGITLAPKYWWSTLDTYYPSLYPESWILIDNLGGEQ